MGKSDYEGKDGATAADKSFYSINTVAGENIKYSTTLTGEKSMRKGAVLGAKV